MHRESYKRLTSNEKERLSETGDAGHGAAAPHYVATGERRQGNSGSTTYGSGTGLRVAFAVNTSMLKFTVVNPYSVWGTEGTKDVTLTYMSNGTALAKATFTVGTGSMSSSSTIYMAVPAGQYSGAQTLVYKSGSTEVSRTLSASKADFKYGQTYSKKVDFDDGIQLDGRITDYTASDGDVLKGTLLSYRIYIPDGATVTFRGMSSKVTCQGSATIILAYGTTNTIPESKEGNPGINVPSGSTLTIRGTGSLNVSCGRYAAGICGVNQNYAAGIGDVNLTNCGDITITGGTVNATGGDYSAGIGSGYCGSCGNITISGGSVTATKGEYAPYSIGKGMNAGSISSSCGTITIGGTNYGTYGISTNPFTWPTAP